MNLTDAQVRSKIGLSRVAIGKLAGVDRDTVERYEINPDAVGRREPAKREALQWVFAALRSLLADAPGRRA